MSYTKLDKCPITPACRGVRLFRDQSTGNVVRFDTHTNDFMPHICNSRSTLSLKPEIAYLGEWYNKETGRTRWIGPERLEKSVTKAPKDGVYRKRGDDPAWLLKGLWTAPLEWKRVEKDGSTGTAGS